MTDRQEKSYRGFAPKNIARIFRKTKGKYRFDRPIDKVLCMALILDGSLEHVAHI